MQKTMEPLFDVAYLITVITLGVLMIRKSGKEKQYLLFGIMAVTLGCGDAFHLVPRIIALRTTGFADYTAALGIGKLITSITMTAFYVLLYYIWRARYQVEGKGGLTAAVYVLALSRIALCLFPQNAWTSANPPLLWGIVRNIPFTVLGALIVVLLFLSAKQETDGGFRFLWLAVVVSFACYLPVVLYAESIPLIGMLMIPKTCAYAWIVFVGYFAMKKSSAK
jgi:hypothetical protein